MKRQHITNPCNEIFLDDFDRKMSPLLVNTEIINGTTWYTVSISYEVSIWLELNYSCGVDFKNIDQHFAMWVDVSEPVYLMMMLRWA